MTPQLCRESCRQEYAECEPLIMTHLIRKGMTPCDYICGKQGGVRWSFITDIPEDKVLTLHSKFINMEINKKRRT